VSRLYHAWDRGDERALQRWNQFLYAARDSREARETDHHLGITLARLLIQLGEQSATAWHRHEETTYALAFSWAARAWNIPLRLSIHAFLWQWCENQVIAAVKLIPLGQTAGQKMLSALQPVMTETVGIALRLPDRDRSLVTAAPGWAMLQVRHEDQCCRLFRS